MNNKYKHWLVEDENELIWLKLNRLDKKNAFNPDVMAELWDFLNSIEKKEELRILIITSVSDELFSAGADIEWFYNLNEKEGFEVSIEVQKVFGFLEKLPIPVIFIAKGLNLTAGFELMLASDMIFAADNAKLGQIETKWALTPGGGGSQRLTRLVGVLKSREMIYTAKIIDAEEALRIGLVNEVIPLVKIDDYVRKVAENICKRTKQATSDAKYIINTAFYPQEHGFKEEQVIFGKRFGSGEPRKAFSSFINKIKR